VVAWLYMTNLQRQISEGELTLAKLRVQANSLEGEDLDQTEALIEMLEEILSMLRDYVDQQKSQH
jgi:hypothetical protein